MTRPSITDDMVERAARAAYRQSCREAERGAWWSKETEDERNVWRRIARAALEAALSGEKDAT